MFLQGLGTGGGVGGLSVYDFMPRPLVYFNVVMANTLMRAWSFTFIANANDVAAHDVVKIAPIGSGS
jgi:hypothetical protein